MDRFEQAKDGEVRRAGLDERAPREPSLEDRDEQQRGAKRAGVLENVLFLLRAVQVREDHDNRREPERARPLGEPVRLQQADEGLREARGEEGVHMAQLGVDLIIAREVHRKQLQNDLAVPDGGPRGHEREEAPRCAADGDALHVAHPVPDPRACCERRRKRVGARRDRVREDHVRKRDGVERGDAARVGKGGGGAGDGKEADVLLKHARKGVGEPGPLAQREVQRPPQRRDEADVEQHRG